MDEDSEKTRRPADPERLPIFDPENLPFQVQHLCVYLREVEEEESRSAQEEE